MARLLLDAKPFEGIRGREQHTDMSYRMLAGVILFGVVSTMAGVKPVQAACADFNDDGAVTAVDALGILQVATGAAACDVYRCDVDGNGAVSASDALATLRVAVGQGSTLACPPDPAACLNDMEFFFERIWTPIQTDCVNCHVAGGVAGHTRHILFPPSQMGYLELNFEAWRSFAALPEGRDLLLTKPQGINHGGGQRLGITPESVHYQNMLELFDRFDNPITNCGGASDFWQGVEGMSDLEVLEKAAILFAARRPTAGEIDDVARGGETALRRKIRVYMSGPVFEDWLMEAANDRLLTDKYLIRQTNAFGVLKGEYQYPHLYDRIEVVRTILGEEKAGEAWDATNRALAREPLRLFVHIAKYEKPYTEIVTADYIMVNPFSAAVYNTKGDIQTSWDEGLWRAGRNNGYRLANYPHAGILTSPMFLARFPSTATNRNRARARWIAKFFLGLDIEKLAQRTVDPAELDEADNPTMNNPACTVCHAVMDPIAGTFQNFGDDGLYLENDTDSLPWSYKRTELYEHGDRWYRDMRSPGFDGDVMPETQRDRALEWLGQKIAASPRFARGAVEFWYQGLFGRPPLERPSDPSRPDYRARLNAWVAQDEWFDEVAAKFRDGTAGTGRNGPYNLKDLLVELVVSAWFRASRLHSADANAAAGHEALGFVKLLTPEQLDRKITGLTGVRWAKPSDPDHPYLLDKYRLFYGGIDSSGITRRADELNALMSTVPQRMANELACPLAVREFSKPARTRVLFPLVEPTDTPDDPNGEAAIRENIVWLHSWLLGETLADGDPEIERTYGLFDAIRRLRTLAGKSTNLRSGAHCELDWSSDTYVEHDDNHTIRAWTAVLAYLLSDYRFIYE